MRKVIRLFAPGFFCGSAKCQDQPEPTLESSVMPTYPVIAAMAHVEGDVRASFVVDAEGVVVSAPRARSSSPALPGQYLMLEVPTSSSEISRQPNLPHGLLLQNFPTQPVRQQQVGDREHGFISRGRDHSRGPVGRVYKRLHNRQIQSLRNS
jgi:hypothetical protein